MPGFAPQVTGFRRGPVQIKPGDNPGANLRSISHRCYLREVAFEWELTRKNIYLPLGCLQGGFELLSFSPAEPPWRQPRSKLMVSLVNSHANATRIGWHPWEIDSRFVPQLPPGWYRSTKPTVWIEKQGGWRLPSRQTFAVRPCIQGTRSSGVGRRVQGVGCRV